MGEESENRKLGNLSGQEVYEVNEQIEQMQTYIASDYFKQLPRGQQEEIKTAVGTLRDHKFELTQDQLGGVKALYARVHQAQVNNAQVNSYLGEKWERDEEPNGPVSFAEILKDTFLGWLPGRRKRD